MTAQPSASRPTYASPCKLSSGEKNHRRYLPLQNDICVVAYWYQTLPTAPVLSYLVPFA